jgi:hypothetical protein
MFHQVYDAGRFYHIYPLNTASERAAFLLHESAEFDKLMTALETGTPAVLDIYDRSSGACHAIVAYAATLNSDGTVSIDVSDPNHPQTRQIATYDPRTKQFSYPVDWNYSEFEVTGTPEIILNSLAGIRSWNFGNSKWYGNWLSDSTVNYYIIVATQPVYVSNFYAPYPMPKTVAVPLNAAYFKSPNNSQTFVSDIPGCCGITEGGVQVYAIPSNTGVSVVDPGSNESTTLITLVDNASGQLVGSGYFLNATTTQGFLNYTVSPSGGGLSLSTGDNGLNASVTFFSATLQDYSVSQPLNVQVDPAQTVNFTALYVTDLVPSKNIIGQGSNVPVNVTILSTAGSPQNVGLTVFANTTAIHTEIIPSLPNGTSTHSFVWNTSSLAYGNYTITALTRVFTNDTTIAGGNCTFQTTVPITLIGDIHLDGWVDILDAIVLAHAFGTKPDDMNWNANADMNSDGHVDILDAILLANNFNKHVP